MIIKTYAMKKKLILMIAGLVALCASAQEKTYTYSLNVGQFDKVKVTNNINVRYTNLPDSTGMVVYRGNKEFDGAFIISNNNGTLKLQTTTDFSGRDDLPTIYIYSDFLVDAVNSSTKTLEILSVAPCAELKLKQVGNGRVVADNVKVTNLQAKLDTGNGSVVVSGTANKAKLKLVGTGTIQADQLKANIVDCTIGGTGSIGCWAEDKLSIKGVGSTTIYYKGNPQIKKSSIGGKLEKIR